MKFRSVTGADVYLGLTSGHTAVVSPDGTELDKQFHKEAIAQGCLPEGVSHEEEEKTPSFDRKKVIKETLRLCPPEVSKVNTKLKPTKVKKRPLETIKAVGRKKGRTVK